MTIASPRGVRRYTRDVSMLTGAPLPPPPVKPASSGAVIGRVIGSGSRPVDTDNLKQQIAEFWSKPGLATSRNHP